MLCLKSKLGSEQTQTSLSRRATVIKPLFLLCHKVFVEDYSKITMSHTNAINFRREVQTLVMSLKYDFMSTVISHSKLHNKL